MAFPSPGMDLVFPSVVVLVLAALLSAFHALVRRQQPAYAVIAVASVIAAAIIPFSGTKLAQAKPVDAVPINVTDEANYYDRWMANRDMWGDPIGFGFFLDGVFAWPFTQGLLGYHPHIESSYWRMQGLNIGLKLAKYYGVEIEERPVTPTVLATYLAQLNKRGIDTIYWLGYQRTSPVKQDDGSYWVFFDKSVLKIPGSNLDLETDPAAVVRLPAGSMLMSLLAAGPGALDPWNNTRKLLLGVSLLLLAASAAPLVFSRLRGSGGAIDF